jgi:hypothetical protein
MIRFVMIAGLLVGCRHSLEDSGPEGSVCVESTSITSCLQAEGRSDLGWIEQNIFISGCALSSSCHNGANTNAGRMDLSAGKAHASLVNVASRLEPSRKLVVPNDVAASYLMLMLRDFPPSEALPPGQAPPSSVGYMPQGGPTLCCQKLDAIERWIMAGAPIN